MGEANVEAGSYNVITRPLRENCIHLSSFMIAILVSECGQSQGQYDDDQGGREVPQRPSRHHPHQHTQLQRQQQ